MRSSTDLRDALTSRGVAHEIVNLPSSSRTAQLAAEALGVPVADVIKSLLFMLDDTRPVLALVTGDFGGTSEVSNVLLAFSPDDVWAWARQASTRASPL